MNLTRITIPGLAAFLLFSPAQTALFAQSKPVAVGEIRNIGNPLTTRVQSVTARGRYAWVGTTEGLYVYDISTPSSAVFAGREATPYPGSIRRIALSGSYAYLANTGLRIVDTSNPGNPSTLSYIDQGNNGTNGLAMNLAVAEPYVYLANGADGLRVFDVSNPYSPTNIAHWPNPNADFGSFHMGITLDGNHAYLAAYNDGLRIFDVKDPATPRNIAFVPDEQAREVAVHGNRLYLLSSRLSVYDITIKSQPVLLNAITDIPNPAGLAVLGNLAYVASSGYTMFGPYFYDVSNPAALARIAPKDHVPNSQGVWDMTVADYHAYMALDFGVGIYSLGQPTAPALQIEKGLGRSVVLSWATPTYGYVPQVKPEMDSAEWSEVTDFELSTTNGLNRLTVPTGKENGFYRLICK